MRRWLAWMVGASACVADPVTDEVDTDSVPEPHVWPEPSAWGPRTGPGVGAVTFTEEQLWQPCANLQGDPLRSADHHNLVAMVDGYVLMPWAPEDGVHRYAWNPETDGGPTPTPESPGTLATKPGVFGGGITFWDFSEPCAPTKVGEAWSPWMRESHTLGFSRVGDRTYLAVDFLGYPSETPGTEGGPPVKGDAIGGVGFWDITDPTAPFWASQVALPGHTYPDSYTRLTLSTFWQGPYVFASTAFRGIFVVDARDPLNPFVVDLDPSTEDVIDPITFPLAPVGSFHVWGNRAMASSAGVSKTGLFDVSDPLSPFLAFEGEFYTQDLEGDDAPYYFANLGADHALFARKESGGGPVVYDISEPDQAPVFVGQAISADGDGGYVFQHGNVLFQGESNFGALYDFTDPALPVEIGRVDLPGDVDTITPLGHLIIASVDEGGVAGEATKVFPWTTAPDAQPPRAGMRSPEDGATAVPITSRVGVVFDEMIEPVSAFEGSFRVASADDLQAVPGSFNVQENIVNFTPDAPLRPGVTYTVELPADGLIDLAGNPLAEAVMWSFETAAQ